MCPVYTPDFVKLAESYGAFGIRVTSREEVEAAFKRARENNLAPAIIEFIIEPEENVLPIVQGVPLPVRRRIRNQND